MTLHSGGSLSQITCRWPDKNPTDIFTASVLKWAFPGIQTGRKEEGGRMRSAQDITHHTMGSGHLGARLLSLHWGAQSLTIINYN